MDELTAKDTADDSRTSPQGRDKSGPYEGGAPNSSNSPAISAQSDASVGKPLTAQEMAATSPDVAAEKPASEARQAYGTAKTENLRDSGLWRILLPAFVAACCLAVLAIPLIILIPLLLHSLSASAASNAAGIPLSWLWIVMIVIVLGIAAVIIRGLVKIFMTQAGNYRG